jgi:hypothetical protein
MGTFAAIDGPYDTSAKAVADCNARQLSTPTVNGVPVRWVTPTLNA